jgi:hypothetical protein
MSDHGDINTHQATFEAVVSMIKWGTIATVIVVAFVIILIAR